MFGPVAHEPLRPVCVLLLPRPLEQFILRDQAEDLLKADGVIAVDPARVPYGAFGRMPELLSIGVGARQARRLAKALRKRRMQPRVVVVFHPLQYYLAAGMIAVAPDCELWYGRWDRYEEAYDASPGLKERLRELHERTAGRAALTFVASGELAALEHRAGRQAKIVGLAADSFPAPPPAPVTVAVSLGHLGHRTDWALLRAVAEDMRGELVLLLVGERHDEEMQGDEDFAACTKLPNLVWLGRQDDQAAARLIQAADVGIVPFEHSDFNDAALPYRILKYARLGRRTVCPDLAGVRTWQRAVEIADTPDAFAAALRAAAGARNAPDMELREWALAQTARTQNEPLWDRLEALGVLG
ncbi:MAG TPA: glycosyltransferase [Solirubrobacteraceae bacterium]|nr:glycosyltransferase [Solirubrobacteraceae bacterium]